MRRVVKVENVVGPESTRQAPATCRDRYNQSPGRIGSRSSRGKPCRVCAVFVDDFLGLLSLVMSSRLFHLQQVQKKQTNNTKDLYRR